MQKRHFPALDGLRGLAVAGVLAFHDGRLPGGYLGVDLFFVLSGFLITANLLSEREASGRLDLAAFWVRRARRLFPALVLTVGLVGLGAALLANDAARLRVRGDGFAALTYVANWHAIVAKRSYWDLFAQPSPLEHMWSLSIEEQFYVLWPLLTWGIFRLGGARKALAATALCLAVASAAAMPWVFDQLGSARAYLGTDTRAAPILLGSALGCASWVRRPWSRVGTWLLDAAGVVTALCLFGCWVLLDGQSPWLYSGGFLATELGVLVLIVCASQPTSLVAKLLAWPPLRGLGVLSYGLYLAHWPVFVVIQPHASRGFWVTTLARLGVTFGLALTSYHFLENPIRRNGLRGVSAWKVIPATAIAVCAMLVGGTLPHKAPSAMASSVPVEAVPPATEVPLPPDAPKILVLGDSVAQSLGQSMKAEGRKQGVDVVVAAVGDCSLLEGVVPTRSLEDKPHGGGNCASGWLQAVREHRPRITLVLLGGGFFAPAKLEGRWAWACDPGFAKAYGSELNKRLESIRQNAGQLLVAQVPYPVGTWQSATWNKRVGCFNKVLQQVMTPLEGVQELALGSHLCRGADSCTLDDAAAPVRPDGLHFGGEGSVSTARWVLATVL